MSKRKSDSKRIKKKLKSFDLPDKFTPIEQWNVCKKLTPLGDLLSTRTACMYDFLRKNIPNPDENITGYMLTTPVILSFMTDDLSELKKLFKKSYMNYYQKSDEYSYQDIISHLIEQNLVWNKQMNTNSYIEIYNTLHARYIKNEMDLDTGYFNIFLLATHFYRSENWKLRFDKFIENGSIDKHRKLEFYVEWEKDFRSGMVHKAIMDRPHRVRTTKPLAKKSYFTVVFNQINIFRILAKYKMEGLLNTEAGVFMRYFTNNTYDFKTFKKEKLRPSKEIYITFPWFEISLSNYKNTRSQSLKTIIINGQQFQVWESIYDAVLKWYKNSFLNIPDIELYKEYFKFYLVGHSLGGAQANIAASILKTEGYDCEFYCIGSPMVGDQNFSQYMENLFANTKSMNLVNLRYIYDAKEQFWVEYDPVSKFPNIKELVPNARLYAIESGFVFKPVFGAYANQPKYSFGQIFGLQHSRLPIWDKCGVHWDNIHTGRSVFLQPLIGEMTKVRWMKGENPVALNTVVDLKKYSCGGVLAVSNLPIIGAGLSKRQDGYLQKARDWMMNTIFTPTEDAESIITDRDVEMTSLTPTNVKKKIEDISTSLQSNIPITTESFHTITIPQGKSFYKSMTINDLRMLGTRNLAWYGTLKVAESYQSYFGPIFAFKTTKQLRMLYLNDKENIKLLIKLFNRYKKELSQTIEINGRTYKINVPPSYLLRIAVGYKIKCQDVEMFRQAFMAMTGFQNELLPYSPEACNIINSKGKGIMHRFSIYEIDRTVFKNMCYVFSRENIDIDGYVMESMPSAFGVFINKSNIKFPREIMLCTSSGMEHDPSNKHDYIHNNIDFKQNTVTILSLNVHYYVDSSMKEIAQAILKVSPMVICLQEDIVNIEGEGEKGNEVKNIGHYLKGYRMVKRCLGQSLPTEFLDKGYNMEPNNKTVVTYANLGNTIYVKHNKDIQVSFAWDFELDGKLMDKNRYTPRCVSIATVQGITIANVHLSGGEWDDRIYQNNIDVKSEQLKEIIKRFRPDIICGDFNGEFSTDIAMLQIQKNPFTQNLPSNEKDDYLEYVNGWSKTIQNPNEVPVLYTPLYTEKDIGPTSIYGGVPDWVIFNPARVKPEGYEVFKGIKQTSDGFKPKISDHNGIIAQFQNRPAVSTEEQNKLYKLFHRRIENTSKVKTRRMILREKVERDKYSDIIQDITKGKWRSPKPKYQMDTTE